MPDVTVYVKSGFLYNIAYLEINYERWNLFSPGCLGDDHGGGGGG